MQQSALIEHSHIVLTRFSFENNEKRILSATQDEKSLQGLKVFKKISWKRKRFYPKGTEFGKNDMKITG